MSSLLAMSLSMEIIARPETESLSSFIDDLLNVFINFNLLKLHAFNSCHSDRHSHENAKCDFEISVNVLQIF